MAHLNSSNPIPNVVVPVNHSANPANNCLLQALRQFPNLVRWEYERDAVHNKWKKPPVSLRGSKRNPWIKANWCPISEWHLKVFDKLGFQLTKECNLTCIDLDNKSNDSSLYDLHRRILADFSNAYIEVSPSGTGLHIWVWGTFEIPKGWTQKFSDLGVEFYCERRYMTVTFNPLSDRNNPLPDGTERVEWWIAECNRLSGNTGKASKDKSIYKLAVESGDTSALSDLGLPSCTAKVPTGVVGGVGMIETPNHHHHRGKSARPNIFDLRNQELTPLDNCVFGKLLKGPNYGKWLELNNGIWKDRYPGDSQSEPDQAFCNYVAWYTDDPAQVARIFMHSKLATTLHRKSDPNYYVWRTVDRAFDLKGGAQ